MIIAALKEIKIREGRVVLIPDNVRELKEAGHEVLIQKEAGVASGYSDQDYEVAGAEIVVTTEDLIRRSDLVLKVKEPTISEVKMMRPGQIYFGFLHLAAIPETMAAILERKIIAFAFDTVQLSDGRLPLLAPMSEIAGKLATQNGAHFLRYDQGGRGILMGGTSTVPPANVLILGAGVVGRNATDVAIGMGAKVTVLELSPQRIDNLKKHYGNNCTILLSNPETTARLILEMDLVVGAALIVGEKAPHLVSEAMVKTMKKGSVIVDVSVDQGGCIATSEVTTHENPIIVKQGVLHYGVANMPGSVPVTATQALNHASFPYIKLLANLGSDDVCQKYPEMQKALNCHQGQIIHPALQNL